MKYLAQICLITLLFLTACKEAKKETKAVEQPKQEIAFASFGDKITSEDAITSAQMFDKFKTLKKGDTVNVKFASSVKEVCSKKGCWMTVPLNNQAETMVRFKDYGFFMPLDSKDSKVIVAGKAFLTETSVDDLRHYAADAGKTAEEIEKITAPKKEFAFVANGVLMRR